MSSPSYENLGKYHNLEGVTVVCPGILKNKGSGSKGLTKRFPKVYRCTMCLEVGHNLRSCVLKKKKGKEVKVEDNPISD